MSQTSLAHTTSAKGAKTNPERLVPFCFSFAFFTLYAASIRRTRKTMQTDSAARTHTSAAIAKPIHERFKPATMATVKMRKSVTSVSPETNFPQTGYIYLHFITIIDSFQEQLSHFCVIFRKKYRKIPQNSNFRESSLLRSIRFDEIFRIRSAVSDFSKKL